jgi:hypothetical protein
MRDTALNPIPTLRHGAFCRDGSAKAEDVRPRFVEPNASQRLACCAERPMDGSARDAIVEKNSRVGGEPFRRGPCSALLAFNGRPWFPVEREYQHEHSYLCILPNPACPKLLKETLSLDYAALMLATLKRRRLKCTRLVVRQGPPAGTGHEERWLTNGVVRRRPASGRSRR